MLSYHFELLHLADEFDEDPVEDVSEAGEMRALPADGLAVGPQDRVVGLRRAERKAGDQQLVPTGADQRRLQVNRRRILIN